MINKSGKLIVTSLCLCCLALPGFAAKTATKKALPDLKITKLKASRITVNGNTKLIVKYTIKNVGKAPAPASVTKIVIKPLNLESEQTCTPLGPNEEQSTSWYCSITKPGTYEVKAGANYNGAFPEMDSMNNQNSISVGFGRSL